MQSWVNLVLAIFSCVFGSSFAAVGLIWHKESGNFISIFDVPTFEEVRIEVIRRSRAEELHKFNGQVFKIGYNDIKNIFSFYDNDTKVTGVCGEMWKMLSEVLELKIIPIKHYGEKWGHKLENGTHTGLLGKIQRHEVDVIPRAAYFLSSTEVMEYTVPVWTIKFRIYIRPEMKTDDDSWIFNLFSAKVWPSVLLLLILFSVFGNMMGKFKLKYAIDRSAFQDDLFYTFAIFCSQGFIPENIDRGSKILAISKRLFAWMFMIILSSHLITAMSYKKSESPFVNLETFLNSTDYILLLSQKSVVYDNFRTRYLHKYMENVKYEKRFLYVESTEKMLEKACSKGGEKFAMFEASDRQRALENPSCTLVPTGTHYFPTWITIGVVKDLPYRRSLDIAVMRMKEYGLINGLGGRWLIPIEPQNKTRDTSNFNSINLSQVLILFVMLIMAAVISSIICVFENIFQLHQRHRVRMRWDNNLRKQAKRIRRDL